jgi:hypothetical protein
MAKAKMAIWRLSPIEPADPAWAASAHNGPVVVRAASERAARQLAEQAFGVKTRFAPGSGVKPPPWLRPSLTRAERLDRSPYSVDGPATVLHPLP